MTRDVVTVTTTAIVAEVRAEMARQRRTQVALARHLGLSHVQLGKRLQGRMDFRVSELVEIADWLGVPVTQLIPRQRAGAA